MYIQPVQVCYILKVVLASPESHSVLSMCVERSAYVSFLSYKLKQSLLKVWTLGGVRKPKTPEAIAIDRTCLPVSSILFDECVGRVGKCRLASHRSFGISKSTLYKDT